VLFTIRLSGCALCGEAVFVKSPENILNGLLLRCGRCSPKVIKTEVKPLIDLLVDSGVFIAEFTRRDLLF